MRLFISCSLSEELTSYLNELTRQLPKGNLTIPRAFDLTLKFLGETPPQVLDEVMNRFSAIEFSPFTATLTNIDVFTRREIRTIWVGLQEQQQFIALHEQLDKVLVPLYPIETRFTPHITLARAREISNKSEFLSLLQRIPVEPRSFMVDKLILFRSELTASGAIHTPLLTQVACKSRP